jgi:hypothetical protein
MSKSRTIENTLAEAEQIARVWGENPTYAMGDVTLAQLKTLIEELRARSHATEDIRTQLTAAINDANGRAETLNGIVTRARSGFRAFFGPDSTQYEQAGGTRLSDRKRAARKAKE